MLELEFTACRSDLLASAARAATNQEWLPAWARRLQATCGERSLVESVEALAQEALKNAKSFDPQGKPIVRLSALADYFDASIRLVGSGLPKSASGDVSLTGQTRGPRATLGYDTAGRPSIHVVASSKELVRESVAHELGHVLLFSHSGRLDRRAWGASVWSALEEALCNYAGRLLLIPGGVVEARLSRAENLAAFVARDLSRIACVPIRVAALRCLDLAETLWPRLSAFMLWRQYHPLEPGLLTAVAKGDRHLRAELSGRAVYWQRSRQTTDFQGALALWRCAAESVHPAESESAGVMVIRDWERAAVNSLANPASAWYMRPEWVEWRGRPAGAFVPMRRGSSRGSSAVGRAAAVSAPVLELTRENVAIGDFSGEYLVHVFAVGDPGSGTRIVLEAFEEC